MFLIDKYVINTKKDIIFNHEIYNNVFKPEFLNNLTHLIVHGKNGTGKRSLIKCLIHEIYGNIKTEKTLFNVNTYGNKMDEVLLEKSPYHIIVKPNNSAFDKYVLQDIIKNFAQTTIINSHTNYHYKLVIIDCIDKLSRQAQNALRRTMEEFMGNCKFIFICYQLHKIIEPLKSRCSLITIPNPSEDDIFKTLFHISTLEKIKLSVARLNDLSKNANTDIKQGIWLLEYYQHKIYIKDELNWHKYGDLIIKEIFSGKINLSYLRELNYQIYMSNIDMNELIFYLLENILKCEISLKIKYNIINTFSKFDIRINQGKRQTLHLEALILEIFNVIV
jgi:replication factor C subunit 3/5